MSDMVGGVAWEPMRQLLHPLKHGTTRRRSATGNRVPNTDHTNRNHHDPHEPKEHIKV